MSTRNAQLSLVFSCIGHFYFHYFAAMYFTIVIALAADWQQPFHDLIELWTPAAIIIGLASLPAGRLADVWSAPGMHPDSYVEIKDRSKDIIISGGENISSLEVEEVLYKHPDIMARADR